MAVIHKSIVSIVLIASLALQSTLVHACLMLPKRDTHAHNHALNHAMHHMISKAQVAKEMHHGMEMMNCCKHHQGHCSMQGCGLSLSTIPDITQMPLSYARHQRPEALAFSVANPPVESLYYPPIIL